MLLTRRLKDLATAAFFNNEKLSAMSLEEREESALEYEKLAGRMAGTQLELARRYNLERAKFLRGEVAHIADSAPSFAAEIASTDSDDWRKE